MMCSIEELSSDRDVPGSAGRESIFKDDVRVGSSAIEALGLNDVVFEMKSPQQSGLLQRHRNYKRQPLRSEKNSTLQ